MAAAEIGYWYELGSGVRIKTRAVTVVRALNGRAVGRHYRTTMNWGELRSTRFQIMRHLNRYRAEVEIYRSTGPG